MLTAFGLLGFRQVFAGAVPASSLDTPAIGQIILVFLILSFKNTRMIEGGVVNYATFVTFRLLSGRADMIGAGVLLIIIVTNVENRLIDVSYASEDVADDVAIDRKR